jgi:hypothetical protein
MCIVTGRLVKQVGGEIDFTGVGEEPWQNPQRVPPTSIEARMYHQLTVLGTPFTPQVRYGPYYVDAALDPRFAFEADGCLVHGCPYCGHDTPDSLFRRTNRDWNLWNHNYIRVIHIWGHALETEAQSKETITKALLSMQYLLGPKPASVDNGMMLFENPSTLANRICTKPFARWKLDQRKAKR